MQESGVPPSEAPAEKYHGRAFQIFFVIVALLVIPATITLHSIKHPALLIPTSENPTPFGYTISLLLFIVPIVCLSWWFFMHPALQFPRKSFWWTIAVLVPTGFGLDLLFGNKFFSFENTNAVLGYHIPAVGGGIPIEEFIFYVSGFVLILLTYIWCDEYWLSAYNVPDYPAAAQSIPRIAHFHGASVILGGVLLGMAIAYKKLFSVSPEGFPFYFTYLLLAAIIPALGFFRTAKPFINWRAFAFTFFPILLISLLWEATLAIPYRWWGYKQESLMGIQVDAWSNLPIEAVCVWLAVTFATVITYEVTKIWQATGKKALEAFFNIKRRE